MGLHYLHGFKVVMLDLKSPNVLLAADGTAKLADVGLARLMTVTSLSHKVPTGTWAWAAPEALLGHKVGSCPSPDKELQVQGAPLHSPADSVGSGKRLIRYGSPKDLKRRHPGCCRSP